jgi:hypothetical protein
MRFGRRFRGEFSETHAGTKLDPKDRYFSSDAAPLFVLLKDYRQLPAVRGTAFDPEQAVASGRFQAVN